MGIYEMLLPDVGEGIAEAEVVEWNVKPGDPVREDDILAAVMTDKAAVEVPSIVDGKVIELGCEIGQMMPIGGVLIRIEVDGDDKLSATSPQTKTNTEPEPATTTTNAPIAQSQSFIEDKTHHVVLMNQSNKPLAAPSVRARAREEDIDLKAINGSGPAGRIIHKDIDKWIEKNGQMNAKNNRVASDHIEDIPVVGMRRKIAEKMSLSKRQIPHITIVEEIEMTALTELRASLNTQHQGERSKLTIIPFIMKAIIEAVREQPQFNARYDDNTGTIHQYEGVHIGIATQTPNGLTVPVLRHAQAANLWDNAKELARLANSARERTIKPGELTEGTITISSLGELGAIATTPIINHPEVAIVGVNKMQVRPMWDGQNFQPRTMMNISCSFDHRVIDGWDAAVFVRKLKTLLESPAMLFVERS
ncbi:MAG: dihydrolipoamide acetyltransferase family protein [Lentilitoribacter sp.]